MFARTKISPGYVAFPLMGRNFLYQWREKRFIIDEYSLFNPRYPFPLLLFTLSLSLPLSLPLALSLFPFLFFSFLQFIFFSSVSLSLFLRLFFSPLSVYLSFLALIHLCFALFLSSLRYFCFSLVSHHSPSLSLQFQQPFIRWKVQLGVGAQFRKSKKSRFRMDNEAPLITSHA